MLTWDEKTIMWYSRAAKETMFFEDVARRVLPFIESSDNVLDIGCGLGFFSQSLAGGARHVTGVDISPEAIAEFNRRCQCEGIKNVTGICADVHSLNFEESFDVVVMSFYGNFPDDLPLYKRLAKKRIIAALHWESSSSSFEIKPYLNKDKNAFKNRASAEGVAPALNGLGVRFSLNELKSEFGQPLISVEEASDFVRRHYNMDEESRIQSFLDERLQKTRTGYYLPNMKRVGIIKIEL